MRSRLDGRAAATPGVGAAGPVVAYAAASAGDLAGSDDELTRRMLVTNILRRNALSSIVAVDSCEFRLIQ